MGVPLIESYSRGILAVLETNFMRPSMNTIE